MSICAEISPGSRQKVIVNNVSLRVPRGETSDCWGPTAAANPRCCAFWRACAAGCRVASPSTARISPDGEKAARRAWLSSSTRHDRGQYAGARRRAPGTHPHHSPFSNWSAQDDEAIAAALQRVAMLEKSEQGWLSLSGGDGSGCISPRAGAEPSEILLDEPTNIWIYTIRCS
ncbi:iron(III) dicitrate transport ATP-binding protein [Klebsiella pneumoniae subsp. pneumoniae]|nr:iron(III) dicitrate transport ATP-binding protein [Klebsiella pneumoniae subsp. pneumoniae]